MQFNHVPVLFVKYESNFLSGNSIFHTGVENDLKNPNGLPAFKNSNSMLQGNVSFFFFMPKVGANLHTPEDGALWWLLLGDTDVDHLVFPSAEANLWLESLQLL